MVNRPKWYRIQKFHQIPRPYWYQKMWNPHYRYPEDIKKDDTSPTLIRTYPGRLKKVLKSWLRCLQQLHSFPPSWNKGWISTNKQVEQFQKLHTQSVTLELISKFLWPIFIYDSWKRHRLWKELPILNTYIDNIQYLSTLRFEKSNLKISQNKDKVKVILPAVWCEAAPQKHPTRHNRTQQQIQLVLIPFNIHVSWYFWIHFNREPDLNYRRGSKW